MNEITRIDGMRRRIKGIHFVGIGGIGMSGIAEVLLNLGYAISGSDLSDTDTTQRLAGLGTKIHHGHHASNLGDADVVVTSTAVKANNPEVTEAHRRNIPVIPRAEMLAELLKMKFSIAVSGSHGKTTTTSMIATVLANGNMDPTMVIGGKLGSIGSNAKLGNGEVIVAEADESDGSFLKLGPTLAVITNIDLEHLDYYRDMEEIKEAFLQFANIVPFYGSTIMCLDDKNVQEIIPRIKRKIVTYGLTSPADYQARHITFAGRSSNLSVYFKDKHQGEITLNVPGLFNVSNALATVAVAYELDILFPAIKEGLARFVGVQRRLEIKGTINGITVVDDYGHHPTEIRATLAAARQVWKDRIIVVFQPHRYSRTKALFHEFVTAFQDADMLFLMDIYPASEEPIEGVNSARICEEIKKRGHQSVFYLPSAEETVSRLSSLTEPSDVVITLGAGNIWKIGETFLKELNKKKVV
jgi:UDP-N-acetylmuramate--alanine ligase